MFVPSNITILMDQPQLTARSVFYLQLYSSLHGVDAKFTKYCVCILLFWTCPGKLTFWSDHCHERCIDLRTNGPKLCC